MMRRWFVARFDVAGYLDEQIGIASRSHGANGVELVCDCPFCGYAAKLYVNADSGLWICYRCGDAGGTIKLVAAIEGCSSREARGIVAGALENQVARSMDQIRKPVGQPVEILQTQVVLPPEFIPCWNRETRIWNIPRYARDRGMRAKTLAAYGVGYCMQGRYAARLIFPAHVFGKIHTFQGRTMVRAEPKYLGPGGGGGGVYGLDEVIGADLVIVVEGPTDVLGMAQKGRAAVALMGKHHGTSQALLLREAGFRRAIVLLDSDAEPGDGLAVVRVLDPILDDVRIAYLPKPMEASLSKYDPDNAPQVVVDAALAAARHPRLVDRLRNAI